MKEYKKHQKQTYQKWIIIHFFYLCSEKNHPHLQASSRRGNKLKRRKAYYNRQRKDISVSWEMSKQIFLFLRLHFENAIAQFCLVPTWSLPLATHGQPPSSQMTTLNVQGMVSKLEHKKTWLESLLLVAGWKGKITILRSI